MFAQVRAIAFYTLIEALRNRLAWLFIAVALIGIGLSGFLNELAIIESREIQLALLAAFLRLSAVFLTATFVVTSMVREFNDKGLELLLSMPLPRAAYFLGKLAGFATVALAPVLLFGGVVLFLAPASQTFLWCVSLLCELWMVAAFSLLCVLTFNQVTMSLSAVAAFYVLARSVVTLQLIGHGGLAAQTAGQRVMSGVIDVLSALLPHLDRFTSTEWLVYHTGNWAQLVPSLAQSTVYVLLLSAAALFDLYRKNI